MLSRLADGNKAVKWISIGTEGGCGHALFRLIWQSAMVLFHSLLISGSKKTLIFIFLSDFANTKIICRFTCREIDQNMAVVNVKLGSCWFGLLQIKCEGNILQNEATK